MKKIIVLLTSLLCLSLSFIPAFAASAKIHDMDIKVSIDHKGNAFIKETWDMSVSSGTEVYKVMDNMDESEVSDLRVTDDLGNVYTDQIWDVDDSFDEKKYHSGIVQDGDHYELCFGISNYGNRKYTFTYNVTNFIRNYEDYQGINYRFFSDMDIKVEHAKVDITFPKNVSDNNAHIWGFGYTGYVYYNQGNHVVLESTESVEDKVQLLMRFDETLFLTKYERRGKFQKVIDDAIKGSDFDETSYNRDGRYTAYKYKEDWTWLYIVLGVVFFIVLLVVLIFTYGGSVSKLTKDIYEDGTEDYDFVRASKKIPVNGDLLEMYYLAMHSGIINYYQRAGIISALIMKWLHEGSANFRKEERKFLFFVDENAFSMTFNEPTIDNPMEYKFYELVRKAAGKNDILETNELQNYFSNHSSKLEKWYDEIDQYYEEYYKQNGLLREEEVTGKWLFFTLHKTRKVFSTVIKHRIEEIYAYQQYIIDKDIRVDPERIEEDMIYACVLDAWEDYRDQVKDNTYYATYYHPDYFEATRIINTTAQSTSSSSSSSSSGGGGGGASGGGGGGVR